MQIKHPYSQTPYEILSDLEDPEIGILSLDTLRRHIRLQQTKVQKKGSRDAQEVARAGTALLNTPMRMGHDVFLISTLSLAADVSELVEKYCQPPAPALPDLNTLVPLTPLIPTPEKSVPLLDVQIKRQTTFDDPQSGLFAPNFDM